MKIHLLSDLHIEYQKFEPVVPQGTELIVLAGDIGSNSDGIKWARDALPSWPVLYVPGNHEFYFGEYEERLNEMLCEAEGTNVVVLADREFQLDGIRFLGSTLWTDFRLHGENDELEQAWAKSAASRGIPDFDGRIYARSNGVVVPVTPDITAAWHRKSLAWLKHKLSEKKLMTTVVITHHAPDSQSIDPRYRNTMTAPAFASNLQDLASQADWWLHGHTHFACNYRIGKCQVVSNPRGYGAEVPEFSTQLLVDV